MCHCAAGNEVTHLAAAPRRATPAATSNSAATSQSGWLTSSGSIDHRRFGPGMVLDNRYRVLGLLGPGGMGEVYRADDWSGSRTSASRRSAR